MEARIFGYARVSARDQNLDRQLDALEKFPVPKNRIYKDKASGKDFNRPNYLKLIRALKPGDILVVKSIDRLGRNYNEIIDEWRRLTKSKACHIVVLDMPLLDTRTNNNGITGVFIADLVLQLLSYVAQVERENILARQAEGIALARKRGVKFGRPKIPIPSNYLRVKELYLQKLINQREAASMLGVSVGTFNTWLKQDRVSSSLTD